MLSATVKRPFIVPDVYVGKNCVASRLIPCASNKNLAVSTVTLLFVNVCAVLALKPAYKLSPSSGTCPANGTKFLGAYAPKNTPSVYTFVIVTGCS